MSMQVLLLFLAWFGTADKGTWDLLDLAAKDKSAAERLLAETKTITIYDEPLKIGTRAMAFLLISRHRTNPFTKLNYFKEGKKLLELSIARSPALPELRYFRYSTQVSIPGFLNYHSDIAEDKTFLIGYIKSREKAADKTLARRIRKFMLQHKGCTLQELETIRRIDL